MGEQRDETSISLGFRAARGGGLLVAMALEDRQPRLVRSTFVAVGPERDRLALEPYHVAAEMIRDSEQEDAVAAAVAEGLSRQRQTATANLAAILAKLKDDGGSPVAGALLVNRAGWITDLLSYSLAWAEHAPVAEGLAVRDALRHAAAQSSLALAELDEKALPDTAANDLGLSAAEIDARLKSLRAGVKPWRKEQKLACLAAWVALARR